MKIVESVILPTSEYLTFSPYPKANDSIGSNMGTSGYVNLMDYGAKGDGSTNDDNALSKAISDIINKQKAGLIIPQGKTFIFNNVLTKQLRHDIGIYAYGATIKKASLSGYGWLQLRGKVGAKATFAGGTLDGNQQQQQWRGNPIGGRFDGAMLWHNCLLAGVNFDEFFVKDVNFKNVVCDGVRGEDNALAVVSNCSFDNAATFHYNTENGSNSKSDAGAGDQGSGSKFRVTKNNCHFYLLDSTFVTGSIGHQSSFPENKKTGNSIPDDIVTVISNCIFKGFTQDLIHIEDSSKAIFNKVITDCDDDGKFYQPRIWISNSTTVFYSQDSIYNNTVLNFVNRASMKLAIINGGSISSSINYANNAVRGFADIIANTTVKGTKVDAYNSTNVQLQNGGTVNGAKNSDKDILNSEVDLLDSNGGKIATLSIAASVTPIPDPVPTPVPLPGAFTASAGIAISRTDSSNAKTYDVLRCDTVDGVFNTVATNIIGIYIDTTIERGKSYYYQVKSKNESGETLSNIIEVGEEPAATVTPDPVPDPIPDPVPTPTPTPTANVTVGLLPWQHADNIGLKVGRNRVVVSTGAGIMQMQRYNGKVQFAPSVVWVAKSFPGDLTTYEKKLSALVGNISKDKMPFFALENEPNYNEQNGDISTYIQMVRIAINLFKDKGIDVFSGGLTFYAICSICYQLYLKEGDNQSAQVFKDNHLTIPNQDSAVFITQYLQQIQDNGIPIHFNFHVNISQQTLAVLPLVVAKLRQLAGNGKKIMCGECSFSRQSADDVTAALTIMKDLDYVLLYSEESGGNAAVMFNSDMDNAVKNFINANKI